MRATCARVLAAVLMTGSIATVVGMSALFGTPTEAAPPLSAPPAALERSVRLTAQVAPAHRHAVPRLVTTPTIRYQARPQVRARSLVVTRTHRVRRPRPAKRQLTAEKPQPVTTTPVQAASPASAPAPPASAAPAPAAPAADDQGDKNGHGHGHAYGHDKQDE